MSTDHSIANGRAQHSTITLRSSGNALERDVFDDGRPGRPVAPGLWAHGLVGMRERVGAVRRWSRRGPDQPAVYRVRGTFVALNEQA